MKEEDESNPAPSPCLLNETQAVEHEFIKAYERLAILWNPKHPDYTNKYKRCFAIDKLLKIMKRWDRNATRLHVRQKINILRSCYRKDLRKHLASKTIGPDGQEIYDHNPTSWKFYALRFLGCKQNEDGEHINTQAEDNSIVEINLDSTNFDDEGSDQSGNDGPSSNGGDVLQTLNEDRTNAADVLQTFGRDRTYHQCQIKSEPRKRNRMILDGHDNYIEDKNVLDKEFEAIGSNVACKLRRMRPDQRCQAELLINKVLIEGLKNRLTDDTDLTEGYK